MCIRDRSGSPRARPPGWRRPGPPPAGHPAAGRPGTGPGRRRGRRPAGPSIPGRLTDVLVASAGRVWTDLLVACRDDDQAPDLVDLLPGGLPALVDLSPRRRHLARLLEIPTMDLADVVAGLPTLAPEAAHLLYDVFDGADPGTLEQLATMPVPLVDGRTVHGPRGLVLLDGQVGDAALAALSDWGVRVVHPQAAHRLLERLGAQRTDIAGLLRSPAVRVPAVEGLRQVGRIGEV